MKSKQNILVDQRSSGRIDTDAKVTITFDGSSIVGPGQNISEQGVFFVAEGSVAVTVRIEGCANPMAGELVRIETMDEGKVGLAVRFKKPLVLPSD